MNPCESQKTETPQNISHSCVFHLGQLCVTPGCFYSKPDARCPYLDFNQQDNHAKLQYFDSWEFSRYDVEPVEESEGVLCDSWFV